MNINLKGDLWIKKLAKHLDLASSLITMDKNQSCWTKYDRYYIIYLAENVASRLGFVSM